MAAAAVDVAARGWMLALCYTTYIVYKSKGLGGDHLTPWSGRLPSVSLKMQ